MSREGRGRGASPTGDRWGPAGDPVGWERSVRSIVGVAREELSRRREMTVAGSTGLLLHRWARPVLAAAVVVMLTAVGGLLWKEGAPATSATDRAPGASAVPAGEIGSTLEGALYPPVVARWIGGEVRPTVEELAFASVEDGGRER